VRDLLDHANTNPRTFLYQNLTIELHPEVYDPAEDSFLLLESLHINPGDVVLELGTGCGLIALACALKGAEVLCTDINPFAVQLTRRNIERNRCHLSGVVEIRQGDLFSVLKNKELFNVIIFNPPYLPTIKNEKIGGWFDAATNGGRDGLQVTKRFLEGVSAHLLPRGSAYFIFSSLSDCFTLEQYLKKQRLSTSIVAYQRFEGEELYVYCVSPTA
jgi:release factor glutamine methyltransferase